LIQLSRWTEQQFNDRLAGNPIRRIGHERWLRNIAIALGNAPGGADTIDALHALSDHASSVVQEHAAWALRQLAR
jgi:epoxyqueuosine reductase